MSPSSVLYTRELPGGGYVAIEAARLDGGAFHAHVAVERRTDPDRRIGHPPPIIAEVTGPTRTWVFNELYRIACDNVAVASAIRRWQQRDGS